MAYSRRRSFRSRAPRRKTTWIRTSNFVTGVPGFAGVIDLLPSNTTDRVSIVGATVVRIRGLIQANYDLGLTSNGLVTFGILKTTQTGQVELGQGVTPFINPETNANSVPWMWWDVFTSAETGLHLDTATTVSSSFAYRFDVKSQRVLRNAYDSISMHMTSPLVGNFSVYTSTLLKLP